MSIVRFFPLPLLLACQPDWTDIEVKDSLAPVDSPDTPEPAPSDDPSPTDDPSPSDDPSELQPPIAIITGPATVQIDDPLVLSAETSSDPQGFELSYDWFCSDGSASEEVTITLPTEQEQEIRCDLTVTANESELSASDNKDVRIRDGIAQWTFMVYINGDNNLEDAGIEDINEIEEGGGSSDGVNIVVQFDRSRNYSNADGNWDGARRYLVGAGQSNGIDTNYLMDLGRVDSGDWRTIADFAKWGADEFPAEKYALVLWDHGWSWSLTGTELQKGISDDEGTGNYISIAQGDLEELLVDVTDHIGQKLEVLGMDACIMQSWEIAHVSIPYANYYVASQDYEGWDGWEYKGTTEDLNDNPSMYGDELGESISYRFFQSGDLTQSVVDLSQMAAFENKLDELADRMRNIDDRQTFMQSARNSYSYDGDYGFDHDIGNLLNNIANRTNDSQVETLASEAGELYGSVVTSNYAQGWASNATGLSIYSPTSDWAYDPSYFQATWAQNSKWDELIDSFY
ncbi:MAG: clostripain-related cysteine peptidase [Myxococcota bacterium]|nr:clostripain-related cysteine peptidase [Myxococcota bacterium]